MTGKTKPDLGIFLVSEPASSGKTVSAELVLSGGVIGVAAFDSPWPLSTGGYYDVEASTREGETAFLQVASLPKGTSIATAPASFISSALFSVDGRYGAYGAPTDIKIKEVAGDGNGRSFDLSFTALTPSMNEVPRRGLVRALQASGSNDVLLLMCSSSAARWKKSSAEAEARSSAASFRIAATRPTTLKPEASADYRFGKTSGPSNMKSRNDGF